MRLSFALSFLPLALSVAALKVTEPTEGAEIDVSKSFTIKWDSVNTDESTVDIVLVNNRVYPNVEKKIASDVDTSKGSYSASGIKGVTEGHYFQVNLLSTSEHNTGILAQSPDFNVTESASSSTASSSTASTTGTSSTVSSSSASGTSTGSSTGSSTEASTTGTSSLGPTGSHTGNPITGFSTSKQSTDHSLTATGLTTVTGTSTTSTGTATGTSTKTGLATSASGSGSATASPTPSTGAAMSLIAQPIAIAGMMAGALALNL